MTKRLRIPAAALRVASVALLLFCCVYSWINLSHVCHTLLDADASSELVLANLMTEEGDLFLSPKWLYSTELEVRPVSTQMVFSPLFLIFSDWTTVRFVGALILQLLMLGAYGYMARQARMSFNSWCVTASALILPMSIQYGRIVLYHTYYIPHIALAFLLVGLFLSVAGMEKWAGKKTWPIVRTVLMLLIACLDGMVSVRPLMIIGLPLLAASVLCAVGKEKTRAKETLWERLQPVALAASLFAALGAGYLFNSAVLSSSYTVQDFGHQMLMMPSFGTLNTVLNAFLEQFGYEDGSAMFSASGMASLGAVTMAVLAIILCVHTLRHTTDDRARFIQLFAVMANIIIVVVFLLVYGDYLYTLYLMPVTVWYFASLGKTDLRDETPEEDDYTLPERLLGANAPRLTVTKLVATVAVFPMIFSGLYHSAFFRDPEGSGMAYAGLNYNETDDVARLTPVCDFLVENGYTLGYASYWNGAVVTELTDGKARVSPLRMEDSNTDHEYNYHDWLSDLRLRDEAYIAGQKVFLLLNLAEDYAFSETGVLYEQAEKVYDSMSFVVYTFSDPLTVHQYVTGQLSGEPEYEEDEW